MRFARSPPWPTAVVSSVDDVEIFCVASVRLTVVRPLLLRAPRVHSPCYCGPSHTAMRAANDRAQENRSASQPKERETASFCFPLLLRGQLRTCNGCRVAGRPKQASQHESASQSNNNKQPRKAKYIIDRIRSSKRSSSSLKEEYTQRSVFSRARVERRKITTASPDFETLETETAVTVHPSCTSEPAVVEIIHHYAAL